MPKQPTFTHALRFVREEISLTQSGFATQIGVSMPHIQAIENGVRPMTPDLAARVMELTGVSPISLLENIHPPRDIWGDVYSVESYKRIQHREEVDLSEEAITELLKPIRVALTSAAKSGRLSNFTFLLGDGFEKAVSGTSLGPDIQRFIEESSSQTVKMSAKEMRSIPHLAGYVRSEIHDDELVTLTLKSESSPSIAQMEIQKIPESLRGSLEAWPVWSLSAEASALMKGQQETTKSSEAAADQESQHGQIKTPKAGDAPHRPKMSWMPRIRAHPRPRKGV